MKLAIFALIFSLLLSLTHAINITASSSRLGCKFSKVQATDKFLSFEFNELYGYVSSGSYDCIHSSTCVYDVTLTGFASPNVDLFSKSLKYAADIGEGTYGAIEVSMDSNGSIKKERTLIVGPETTNELSVEESWKGLMTTIADGAQFKVTTVARVNNCNRNNEAFLNVNALTFDIRQIPAAAVTPTKL